MKTLTRSERRDFICSITMMGLGLLVVIGWFTKSSAITQIHPSFAPMQFNTALGFIACGAGQYSLALKHHRLLGASGLFLLALGLVTLFEYASGFDLGIDELIVDHYTTTKTSHPGRMAPNTALCFSLFGAYLLVSAYSQKVAAELRRVLQIIPAALVLSLGGIALGGYIFSVETSYGWGHLTRMAVHTSSGFILLGATSTFNLMSNLNFQQTTYMRPALFGIAMGTSTVLLWAALEGEERAKLQQLLDFQAQLTQEKLLVEFDQHHHTLKRMSERVGSSINQDQWRLDAQSYLRDIPALISLTVERSDGPDWVVDRDNVPSPPQTDGEYIATVAIALEFQANQHSRVLALYDLIVPVENVLANLPKSFGATAEIQGVKVNRNGQGESRSLLTSTGIDFELRDTPVYLQLHSNGNDIAGYGGSGPTLTLIVGLILSTVTVFTGILLSRSRQIEQELMANKTAMQDEIDTRKRLQKQLEENSSKLESTVEALEDFAYIASHDLKEPLRGIRHLVKFVAEDNGDQLDAKGHERLDKMKAQTTYLGKLIDDLLTYSRAARDIRSEPVDLDALLEEVLDSLSLMIEENNAKITHASKLGIAACDRAATGEVFRNLVTNAIKYNDNDEKLIEIGIDSSQAPGTYFVRDNGIGIDEEDRDEVFRIFARLFDRTEYGGGTGAGLTIVKKIVENQGGKIRFDSKPGKGTTFFFTLGASSAA